MGHHIVGLGVLLGVLIQRSNLPCCAATKGFAALPFPAASRPTCRRACLRVVALSCLAGPTQVVEGQSRSTSTLCEGMIFWASHVTAEHEPCPGGRLG